METFLGLGGWGALWRRASQRAHDRRAAERRGLPRALVAKEVEDFRKLLNGPAVVAMADAMITQLEAVAGWGKDLWRSRQDATVASGAPDGSPLHGAGSQEALAQ